MAAHTTRSTPPRQRRHSRPASTAHSRHRNLPSRADRSHDVNEILREELNLLYAILNTSSAIIVVTDPDGQIVRCNSACEGTIGYSFDDLKGKSFQSLALPQEMEMITAVFTKLRTGHTSHGYTSHWITRQGNQRLIVWSHTVLHGRDGVLHYIICTGTDITERQAAEENIHFQAHLLDIVEQAIVATNLDGTIIYQNRFAESLYGWKVSETVGRNIQDITTDGSARAQELAILARVGMKKSWTDEVLIHRWDGTPFPALVTASPIYDEQGSLLGTITISTNITEQKQAESQLEHYIKRLENLRDIEHAILLAQSPETVAEAALKHIQQLIPYQWGSVAVFDFQSREMVLLKVQSEWNTRIDTGVRFPMHGDDVLKHMDGDAVYINEDVQAPTSPPPMPPILREEGVHTYMRLPLKAHDKLIGSLILASATPLHFTPEYIDIAQEVADQLAIAIHNAQLFAEVKHHTYELEERVAKRTAELSETNILLSRQIRERELAEAAEREQRALAEALREIAGLLNSTLNLDEVLVRILANVGRVVPHDAANIMFIEAGLLRVARSQGYQLDTLGEAILNLELPIGDLPLMQTAVDTGEAIIVADTRQFSEWVIIPGARWVRSYIGAPISLEGTVIGFLNVDSATPGFFTPLHAERLGAFADQAAIAIQNARLYEQSQTVAALEERQRLSHELHDAISQTLWSASLIADVLPDLWEQNVDKGRQKLIRLRQLTRGALSEMRTLLLELHPTALIEVPLNDLLNRLCEIMTSRTGVNVDPVMEGQIIVLPPEVQLALYRIVQEALNNIGHHAAASQVIVHLRCEPDLLTLRISDNGRGFVVDHARPGHMGIDVMRQRARSIGAVFTINSQIGQGTEITLTWCPEKE